MLSAPATVTPPAGELITLGQAKTFLRVDGNALDTDLELTIAAAIGDLERLTGVRMLNQEVEVRGDCFADLAHLKVGPVRQIASIGYCDAAGVDQLLGPGSYELYGGEFEQGVRPVFGQSWPAAASRKGAIVVTLQVGYGLAAADVPAPLRYAAFAILRGKFEERPVSIERLIANHRFWL